MPVMGPPGVLCGLSPQLDCWLFTSCSSTWRSTVVVFREVDVVEVREVLRGWLDGVGLRTVAARAGVDRKTARRYVQAAQEAGRTLMVKASIGRAVPERLRLPSPTV